MLRALLLSLITLSLVAPAGTRADEANYQTIDQLGSGGSPQAAETLLGYLDSDDPQERWRAARALGSLTYKPAAPRLAALLGDPDPVVQTHAMISLTRIGDVSPEVVDAIVLKVGSNDERVARTALQTLKHLQPGPEKLTAALANSLAAADQSLMIHAVEAIVEAGGNATPLLEKALGNERTAYLAAVAVSEIGEPAADTSDELLKLLLTSQDPQTQHQALLALAAIGDAASNTAPAVQKVATDTQSDAVRITACYALGMLGDASSTALLRKLSTEGGEFQQMVAAWSIAKLNPTDAAVQRAAIGKLTQGLKSDRPEVRDAAATGLSKLDAPADEVAPAMLAALEGADQEQKSNIAAALATLGPKVLDRATAALGNPAFTDIAIEVLGRLGADAAPASDALAAQLQGADDERRARINFAIASIGPGAAAASEAVAAGLQSDSEAERQSALFALRQIGAGASAAGDKVAAFMQSTQDPFEQLAAAWSLASMKPSGAQLAPLFERLTRGLASQAPQERLETIHAIASLGPAGAPLAAAVKKVAQSDSHSDIREAAGELAGRLTE